MKKFCIKREGIHLVMTDEEGNHFPPRQTSLTIESRCDEAIKVTVEFLMIDVEKGDIEHDTMEFRLTPESSAKAVTLKLKE